MQVLTAPPRDHLTDEQIVDLLTGDDVEVSAGLEVLDGQNRFVADISDDLIGGSVDHDGRATVHGSCQLQIQRPLAWGRDRVRPYMTLSNAAVSARFNLGVFVLTTPQTKRGEDPITYDVDGYDLLQPLLDPIGDTYVVEGLTTTYLEAITAAVAASGVGAPLRLDGTALATVVPSTMVWALTDSAPVSWLNVINDLLAAINYRELWADENGTLRSEPYMDPATRPVEWVFDTEDASTNIVGEDRTIEEDVWDVPNWWRFVRRGMTTTPVEGDGLYTVENLSRGPASQESLGRVVRTIEFLDAADQAALEAQGNRIVIEATAVTRKIQLSVDPLPIAGHLDVVRVVDGDTNDRAVVVSAQINLDGSAGTWDLEAVG